MFEIKINIHPVWFHFAGTRLVTQCLKTIILRVLSIFTT